MEYILQKKISVSGVNGKTTIKRIVEAGDKLDCGQYMGRAMASESGESTFGPWTAMTGQFRAISPDGEVFDSAKCFLPDVVQSGIIAQLNKGAVNVDFAVHLYAVADEKSPVGFSYRFTPLLDSVVEDPISLIQAKLAENKRLSAPKAEEKKEPPKAGKK